MTAKEVLQVKEESVVSVYSGKPGCMCGCNGKYSYSEVHREFSTSDRGYEVTDDEINDKEVKRITKLINDNLMNCEFSDEKEKVSWVAFDKSETRTYVLYYRK